MTHNTERLSDEKLIRALVDCLTAEDAVQWNNTAWYLDELYEMHQHPVLCNARIRRTLKTSGDVSIKKM